MYHLCTIYLGSRVGAVVRALAFHQYVPGLIPALGVISGLSLLVLYSAPRGFSPGTPVFPSPQKPTFHLSGFTFGDGKGLSVLNFLIYLFTMYMGMQINIWLIGWLQYQSGISDISVMAVEKREKLIREKRKNKIKTKQKTKNKKQETKRRGFTIQIIRLPRLSTLKTNRGPGAKL